MSQTNPEESILTIEEAATILARSPKTIRNRLTRAPDDFPPTQTFMGRRCWSRAVWDEWWASRHKTAPPEIEEASKLRRLYDAIDEAILTKDWSVVILERHS